MDVTRNRKWKRFSLLLEYWKAQLAETLVGHVRRGRCVSKNVQVDKLFSPVACITFVSQ